MRPVFLKRLEDLQVAIKQPLLIKKKENLFYLTGFSFDHRAEEYLLVKPMNTDKVGRKNTDPVGFGSGLEQIDWIKKSDSIKNIGKYLKGAKHLDVEYKFTYGEGKYLKSKLPGVKIQPVYSPADKLRMIKEPGEIALVRRSMQIVEKVFQLVRREIRKPGMTEIRLAQFIQNFGLRMGAEDISFPAIVASGPNAAVPHHVPSNKRLKAGESIIIDFGFKYKNYCSDFTRTVFLKKVPRKLEMSYNQVERAYNVCLSLRGGVQPTTKQSYQGKRLPRPSDAFGARNDKHVTGNELYQRAVSILAEKHLEKYFIHSLGHGTGLEIHELPNLSPNSKDVLEDGMVFSIEPGVYFPNLGGIRIEDLVYLENDRVKKFINVPTKLESNIF